jgi:lipopolysaccharide/colanic/teichoic acid biosynthesis glycosyltransferase
MDCLKNYLIIKRIFDFCLACSGIIFSLPLWLIFGFLVWQADRGHIFYLQERVGKNSRIFKGIKFRSMQPDAEEGSGPVQAKDNDPRVTNIGRFLRKTAMDELPQLWNIFKGDMSFVGPRALRPKETELNDNSKIISIFEIPGFQRRASIKPGLTGAAQVFASRKLSRKYKFNYDLWYVDNMSFWLDIKLIIKSFLITFRAKWDT